MLLPPTSIALGIFRFEVPVEPTPPEAVDWLTTELAKPEYQNAKPTALDLIGHAIANWLSSLSFGDVVAPPPVIALLLALAIAIVVVVLYLVFGRPRLNRSTGKVPIIFGSEDHRTAQQLRQDAASAAKRRDWPQAIKDQFRAIARASADRDLVMILPGTTAREFAHAASATFPTLATELAGAVSAFDAVRYLDAPGEESAYRSLVILDERLLSTRPLLESAGEDSALAAETAVGAAGRDRSVGR